MGMLMGGVEWGARHEQEVGCERLGARPFHLCADSAGGRSVGWNSSARPLRGGRAFVTLLHSSPALRTTPKCARF